MDEKDRKAMEELYKHIHEAFENEGVFVTSTLNYIVYESGFKAGIEYAQKTAHNAEDMAEAVGIIKDLLDELKWQSSGNVANVDVNAFLAKHKGETDE